FQLLTLDSAGLKIESATLLNTLETLHFEQRGENLLVDLGRPYRAQDTLRVEVRYHWVNQHSGMYFHSRPGANELEAIYSHSEAEESRYWFPSNSHPNDRATYEAILRVPKPFVAVSNGALVGVED